MPCGTEAAASRLKVDNLTGLRAQCSRLTAHAFQASASRISKKSRRALPVNFAAAGQTTFGKHKADARRVHDSLNHYALLEEQVRRSPNQVLTHSARAARAKGSGQS